MPDPADIHPEFARMLDRPAKEALLGQRGRVVWFFGLSGSGKSTLAHALERALHARGRMTALLDGDNLRSGLNAGLGFTDEDRAENIRRAAEVARLFAANGIITVASFICPRRVLREMARQIIGAGDLDLVYVQASYETCRQRDVKGLYAKAGAGKVAHFTGKDSGFEEPAANEVLATIDTESCTVDEAIDHLLQILDIPQH